MEMQGERSQPRRRKTDTKNRADLADELEFFIGLHDKLKKKKKKEKRLAALSNSTKLDPSQIKKQLGFVDRRIDSLRKRLGIARIAQRTPETPYQTEVGMDRGKSLLEDTHGEANLKYPDMFGFKLEIPEPDRDVADGGGDEDDMDWGKSAMYEQLPPRMDTKSKSEMEADASTNEVPISKPDKSVVEPDPITTNMMPKVDGDDPLRPDIMPRVHEHDEDMNGGKSEAQLTEEVANDMISEKVNMSLFRSGWEGSWGRQCGRFPDMTTVSSMQFTHLTPGCSRPRHVGTEITLQIFSFKLAEIKGGLRWPLSVYGVIAARDPLDRNRNLLFSCDRRNSQELSEDDPFLRLIGPSRAIVFTEPVDFEVQLKVKGRAKPDDRALITGSRHFTDGRRAVSTLRFKNCFCTAELCLEPVEGTVQATILGVRVVKDSGSWPFEHGVRVVCSPSTRTVVFSDDSDDDDDDDDLTFESNPPSGEIVLLDSKDGARNKDSEGHLHLSRQVVSVQSIGKLDVTVQAYSPDGGAAAQGHVSFDAKECQVSQAKCLLGNAEVEITVAWSLLVGEKEEIAAPGWVFEEGEALDKF